MSTQQQKIIREKKRQARLMGRKVGDKKEKDYFQQRLNYPEIYGEMPEKVVNQLKKFGIRKREKNK